MNAPRISGVAGGALVVLLVILVLRQNWRQQAALEVRLRAEAAERARLTEQLRTANDQRSKLAAERNGAQATIAQLWTLVHDGPSKPDHRRTQEPSSTRDLAALRQMAQANGGDLRLVLRQVLTPEALNASLQKHLDEPGFWAAVASLCDDPGQAVKYLESAATRCPESAIAQASLIQSRQERGQADAAARGAIENLRKADPTSSLADHYDAYFRFREGDSAGALQALAAASEKDRFADQRIEMMMNRYQCLLENGCSDGGALALSAFSLGFEHLPMLREVSQKALEQAQAAYAAGQSERALATADYVARIGRNVSASGRFMVYDRVGIELQEAALEAKRRFYQDAGNSFQVGEIDFQLGQLQQRSGQIQSMTGAFGGILSNMTDDGITRYIESTLMQGEFSTLQNLTSKP